jgi:signal transduction histidine kinase
VRRRLLAITLATTTLVVVAFLLPLAGLVQSVARDRAVSGAERDAAALAPVLAAPGASGRPADIEAAIARTATGADGRLTVWLPDGTQVGDPTDTGPDADAVTLARRDQLAFSQSSGGGLDLYSPVVTGTEGTSVVRARLPHELLERGVTRSWFVLAGVGMALVVVAGVIADRLGRSLTREATALAGTARTLAGGDPQARVAPGDTPELADAARALNLLADRIDELRTAERARVADLSHRLRTPLTALRLDAEAAANTELTADVDRLEAAVTDLIRTAQRPLHEGAVPQRCDLAAVVRDRVDFWGALADDDGRDWRLAIDVPPGTAALVGLGADEAAAAIDALLGNVFGHTPDGTAYAVTLQVLPGRSEPTGRARRSAGPDRAASDQGTADEGARLDPALDQASVMVDDAGPGIDDPEAVLARGHSEGSSTGLGLDIARRAAEAAGGEIAVDRSPLGGARITLAFPLTHRG